MKPFQAISFRTRSTGFFLTLALLSPVVFAGEPTKPAEEAAGNASSKINDYRADSSEMNKAEVKAALERLDTDIDLLAAKIDTITESARKAELTQRLKVLKERRKELNSEFRKARYDALSADVKSEWNQLVH
jgi:F0F1-type ATP synthase membrane subunit b/b'